MGYVCRLCGSSAAVRQCGIAVVVRACHPIEQAPGKTAHNFLLRPRGSASVILHLPWPYLSLTAPNRFFGGSPFGPRRVTNWLLWLPRNGRHSSHTAARRVADHTGSPLRPCNEFRSMIISACHNNQATHFGA